MSPFDFRIRRICAPCGISRSADLKKKSRDHAGVGTPKSLLVRPERFDLRTPPAKQELRLTVPSSVPAAGTPLLCRWLPTKPIKEAFSPAAGCRSTRTHSHLIAAPPRRWIKPLQRYHRAFPRPRRATPGLRSDGSIRCRVLIGPVVQAPLRQSHTHLGQTSTVRRSASLANFSVVPATFPDSAVVLPARCVWPYASRQRQRLCIYRIARPQALEGSAEKPATAVSLHGTQSILKHSNSTD